VPEELHLQEDPVRGAAAEDHQSHQGDPALQAGGRARRRAAPERRQPEADRDAEAARQPVPRHPERQDEPARYARNEAKTTVKGTSFDAKSMCQVERARVVDLMSENKTYQKQIQNLETDVNVLKTAISQHKHEKGCMLEDLEY